MKFVIFINFPLLLLAQVGVYFLLGTHPLEAHVPYLSLDKHPTKALALWLDEIEYSKVIYQRLTESRNQSWIEYEAVKGEILYLQVGVPDTNQDRGFRPEIALLAPSDSGKFARGSISPFVYTEGEEAIFFHEPFSDTNSWILKDRQLTLPETGTYYLVSYHIDRKPGKLWVSIGNKERFEVSDLGRMPFSVLEIKKFHSPDVDEQGTTIRPAIFIGLGVLFTSVLAVIYFYARRMYRNDPIP